MNISAKDENSIYKLESELKFQENIDEYFDNNDPKGALKYMLEMRKMANDSKDKRFELIVLNELIGYYRQTSEREELINVINEALNISRDMGILDSIEYATTALNSANAYRSLGMLDEAKGFYDITEKIYENAIKEGQLLEDDLRVAGLYNNESLLYQELSDYDSAIERLQRALKIVTTKNAGFEIAVTYANLANTYLIVKEYDLAMENARKAIRLFKSRGLKDPHYAAALSALATCYYNDGNLSMAATIYKQAMEIVEATIGKNSQYNRLKESLNKCRDNNESCEIKGIELSKAYYEEYGKKMIREKFPEYESEIAIGLVGEGSDCYGYDDGISTDHDYGPDFCMWLTDEAYDKIGERLAEEYAKLPQDFMGYKRVTLATGKGRRGVLKISDFYKKFTNSDEFAGSNNVSDANLSTIDYGILNDYQLACATNGEVFRDDLGLFNGLREKLKKGYPEDIRLLKIAQASAEFSQNAQYNYPRMLAREDETTALMLLSEGMKAAMKLYHYICNAYPPHDKWLSKSLSNLPGSEYIIVLIDKILNQFVLCSDKLEVVPSIEELSSYFAKVLYDEGIISDIDSYLDAHTEEINLKAYLTRLSHKDLVEKIVRLEFTAFDKVKNEGGRAYCQNDWPTFSIMRKSQYLTWDKDMLMQYYYDFSRQFSMGHNLITEKYGRMMESTDKARWDEIKDNFPVISEEKKAIIEQIVSIQMMMMEEFAIKYKKTAGNARSLHTYEDDIVNTSYETYLRGEVSTYSDKMLQLYGKYVVNNYKEGVNIAYITMANTAKLYGYKSLDDFENA